MSRDESNDPGSDGRQPDGRQPDGGGFATRCVHGPMPPDGDTGAISAPIFQSANFAFPDLGAAMDRFAGRNERYVYSRLQNPTVEAFERHMAALEGGEAGVAFASGMGAIAAAVLAHVGPGDRVVSARTVYGGSHSFFEGTLRRFGVTVDYVDGTDPAAFAAAVGDDVRLLYVESPANPTLCIVDIAAVAKVAKAAGVPLIVDNTFATPYFQRPLALGADIVVHSATKYVGGHGDTLGGVVVTDAATARRIRLDVLKELGAVMSPLTAWLLLRGLKTLPLRMDRHRDNALTVARHLERHPRVARLWHPGLESHPHHAVASRQMSGWPGVVAFEVNGGEGSGGEVNGGREAAQRLLDRLRLVRIAVSLGDPDTLIEHPASMTHRSLSDEELRAVGISPGFVRLSVGLEDAADVIADLDRALG